MTDVWDLEEQAWRNFYLLYSVLEMEEVESLVGNANRKRLGNINNKRTTKPGGDGIAICALRSDFLSKLVVFACVILLGVLYMSAQNEGGDGNMVMEMKDVETKDPTVLVVPSQNPITQDDPKSVDVVVVTENPVPSSPTNYPTNSPVIPTTVIQEGDEVVNTEEKGIAAETSSAFVANNEPDQNEDKTNESSNEPENNDAAGYHKYSKYATVLPLVDNPFPDETEKKSLEDKFGRWHFWDGDEDIRPEEDYCSNYPNRDIPGEEFPDDAWQADAVFVNHILNDGDNLIARAMEAIFVEYGHGKPLSPEGMAERMQMFHWSREDLSVENAQAPEKYRKRGGRGNGGWTTKRSFDGLVRRLLHAMMTQDTFTVVMGGHSAAQGQGNHFRQSYMMQFYKVMYPIFARLGVKLITRNVGQGGLGTIQAGMGSGSIYGDEIDVLLWDSGMTEKNAAHVDIFYRQALLAGNRVPVLWGGPFDLLKMLHEEADVDVGVWGGATDGVTEVESLEQAKTIPWAARFMKCKAEVADLCKDEPKFCAKCWIDRHDNIKPSTTQRDKPKGQVGWHPGWRAHQLMGRNLAFAILEALQAAVNIWTEGVMGGPPLEDDFWHVTDYYENIRNKVKGLDKSLGSCYENDGSLPTRLCSVPMKAKTQYTPRANFYESALTTIIKPTADGYIPKNDKLALYEGPDEHNTCFDIPEDEINVFNVVTGRRRMDENYIQITNRLDDARIIEDSIGNITFSSPRKLESKITPGKGWKVWGEPPGLCDGTYNATCNRWTNNDCFLYGHHDARGAVIGNEQSGWLVMTLKDLKEGVIVLKLHTWHTEDEIRVNAERRLSFENVRRRRLDYESSSYFTSESDEISYNEMNDEVQDDRILMRGYDTPKLPDQFAFEYSIDGVVTTLTASEFLGKKKQIQRVVETITILDDVNFTNEAKDVEIAIRLTGSGKSIVFGLSHVYWA